MKYKFKQNDRNFIESFPADESGSRMEANLTLISSLIATGRDGKKGISRGYWGDVVTGPFIAFGYQVRGHTLMTSQLLETLNTLVSQADFNFQSRADDYF